MLAEGAAVHLLLPDGWLWAKVVLAALHLYWVIMLLSWAAGGRADAPASAARAKRQAAARGSACGPTVLRLNRDAKLRWCTFRFLKLVQYSVPLTAARPAGGGQL